MTGRAGIGAKQRGEPFDSPPCRNSHAGTLLGSPNYKGRTIPTGWLSLLFFSSLRFSGDAGAPNAVIPAARSKTKSVRYYPGGSRLTTGVRWVLVAVLGCAAAAGCSRKPHAVHAGESHAPEPPPPTPDTTPIAVLRTPAGLVLGVEGTPVPPVPTIDPSDAARVPQKTPPPPGSIPNP